MLVNVVVKPGSSKGPLVKEGNDGVIVFLRERAHDGEANEALVKVLAKYYGVAKNCIMIKSGIKTKKKLVNIMFG